jgi:hypothetical protein
MTDGPLRFTPTRTEPRRERPAHSDDDGHRRPEQRLYTAAEARELARVRLRMWQHRHGGHRP